MQGYLMIDKDTNVKFVLKIDYPEQHDNGWSRRLLFKSHLMTLIEDLQKFGFKIARISFDDEVASKIFKIILGKDDLKDVQRDEMIADFLKTHNFHTICLVKDDMEVIVKDSGFVELRNVTQVMQNKVMEIIDKVANTWDDN